MKSTMVELVQELERLPDYPEVLALRADAKAGELHDYKNKKYACGKMAALKQLYTIASRYPETKATCEAISTAIKDGEYDETADEEDKEMMRKDILENTRNQREAQAMLKALRL